MFDVFLGGKDFSRRDVLPPCRRRPEPRRAGTRDEEDEVEGSRQIPSSSSTWAAACRTTTASTRSPTRPTRSAASTGPSPPRARPARRREAAAMAKVMDKIALVRSGAQQRPPRDGHELGLSGRFGSAFGDYPAIGAVVAHETGFTGTLPPYVSVPRNPSFTWELGKSASWAAATSRSRPATPTRPTTRFRTVAAEAVMPANGERRNRFSSGRWTGQEGRGQRPDRHLRRVPPAGGQMVLSKEARRPSPSSRRPTSSATVTAATPWDNRCCWRGGWSSRRALRDGQLRRQRGSRLATA